MIKHTKGQFYIRRMKPTDRADSMITAMQMAAKQILNRKPPYVLLRRGFVDQGVMHVADTRLELKRSIFGGGRTFKEIANSWKCRSSAD